MSVGAAFHHCVHCHGLLCALGGLNVVLPVCQLAVLPCSTVRTTLCPDWPQMGTLSACTPVGCTACTAAYPLLVYSVSCMVSNGGMQLVCLLTVLQHYIHCP